MVVVQAGNRPLLSNKVLNTRIGNVQHLVEFNKGRGGIIRIKYPIQLPYYEESIKRAIIEHVSALFKRSSPIIHLEVQIDNCLEELVPIPGVQSTTIFGSEIEMTFLEELFTKYPSQKSAFIDPKLIGDLSVDSKLFELEALFIRAASWPVTSFLAGFNGQKLRLHNTDFNLNDVVSIIEKWDRNEAYQNIRMLHIRSTVLPDNVLFQDINDSLRWSFEPYMFEYYSSFFNKSLLIDCRQYYSRSRNSDGKMAAFRIMDGGFEFYVWDRTRDQFVENVNLAH